jgi:DNA-binding response OmpR family regulator
MAEPLLVLVVDDEVPLAAIVASYLVREGFSVVQAHDGPTAVDMAQLHKPDLIVLDVMLPGFDGVEVCRRVRAFTDAYIIMLTARDEEVDKVVGLSVGADDYLVKPFSPRELIARVRAMLRRPRATDAAAPAASAPPVTFADLLVDLEGRQVTREGERIELTRTEFDLFATLAARPRAAFTRRQLLDAAWGEGWYGDEHVVDVHIAHLRNKIGDDATSPRYIRTVRGVGYGLGSG